MKRLARLSCLCTTLLASAAFAAPAVGNVTPERKAACAALCDRKDNASCKKARPMAECAKTCETFVSHAPRPV